MKIQFTGHSITDREVEITQQELFQLFEMMREQFENHITYGRFNHSYPDRLEKTIVDFCDSHNVDCEYEKDRVAFFNSILQELRNPYH
jgi:hypothetical protein